jgi:alanyl aminopeptidase
VNANSGATGYYHAHYSGDLLERLLEAGAKNLTPAERVTIIGDVAALTATGQVAYADALKLVPRFAGDDHPAVIRSTVGIASGVRSHLVPDDMRPNFERFVRRIYGAKARELGWRSRPGEDDDTRLLRPSLVSLVAAEGRDPDLLAEADQLARKWLADRSAVEPDLAGAVLSVAAENGGREFFDLLLRVARETKDRRQRGHIIRALGSFRDPQIARAALALLLGDDFDTRETMGLFFGPMDDPRTRRLPFEFGQEHYDELVAKNKSAGGMMGEYAAMLPMVSSSLCDEESRAQTEAFFRERVAKTAGGTRTLNQVLERIQLCIARVAAQQPSVVSFLRDY